VIAGAVTLTTTPKVGGVVTLNLPSTRVGHGMFVQLYGGGELTAQAVVSDLDATSSNYTGSINGVSAPAQNVRIPGGHPEGYLEAFANIYRAFGEQLRGGAAGIGEPGYATMDDTLSGMKFLRASLESSRQGAVWVEL